MVIKNEILNTLYNKNSIRFKSHLHDMLDTSQFVLDCEKDYWYAWIRHGISLALNGYSEDAEEAFNRAIKLAQNNFEAIYMVHI